MQDAALERLSKLISDKPDGSNSRPRKPSLHIRIGMTEGWFTFALLAIVIYSTIWCVQSVGWVDHLNVLTLTTALGLITGVIAAKQRRLPRLVVHPIAAITSFLISFWQTAGADYAGNTAALLRGLRQWLQIALAGGASSNDAIFLLFITALGFLLAYTSAWLVYRTRNPWLVIVANGVVLLINLNNAASGFVIFLVIFLIASLLLLLRFNLHESVQRWHRLGLRHSDDLGWDFMQAGALISIGVLIFAWLLPFGYVNETASQVWNADANPYIQLERTFNRLVSVSGGFTPSNHGNFTDTLSLGGNPNLNNDIVFTVQSDDGTQYLESLSFSTYDGRNWTNGPTFYSSLKPNETIQSKSALWHPVHQVITVVDPPGEQNPYLFGASQIGSLNQPAQVVTSVTNGLVIAWLSRNGNLAQGERYSVTSDVSSADIATLRTVPLPANAPTVPSNLDVPTPITYYDPGILNAYLQLPSGLDPNIANLAQSIITKAHATNMYDEAVALENYLRTNYRYNANIRLPAGQEGVSWFLFRSGNQGFCNYFASAMTVMARLLGMPARVVDGYTNGEYDAKHNRWVIRGVDSHAWAQIYFAGYGWVNFEPSAGFSTFGRPLPGTSNATSTSTSSGPGSQNNANSHGRTRAPTLSDSPANATTAAASQGQAVVSRDISLGLGGIILLALFSYIVFSIWWRRLFRGYRISAQLYGRLCLLANWAGITLRRSQTPYEYIETLSEVAPSQAVALERFGDIYVRDLWADPASKEHPRRTGEIKELPEIWKGLQPAFFLYVLRHPYFLRWLPTRLSNLLRVRRVRPLPRRRSEIRVEEELKEDFEI